MKLPLARRSVFGAFLRLPRAEQACLVRAAVAVTVVRLALKVLPFRTIRQVLTRVARPANTPPARDAAHRIGWAVAALGRRLAAPHSCLTEALAAHVLLERTGVPSQLHLGVAKSEAGQFEAHAWVESEGAVVVGGADRERYTPLTMLVETSADRCDEPAGRLSSSRAARVRSGKRSPVPILFTIPDFLTAGSGGAMLNIITRLDRHRFAPSVCVLKRGGTLAEVVERLGIPLLEAPFAVPVRPRSTFLMRAWRAASRFRPHRFAIWHSFHYDDDYSEPIIARLAGTRRWVYTKKNMSWHRRGWYVRTLLASRVIAQNGDMMERFFAHRPWKRKVQRVSRGVDTARFRPGLPPRLQLRARTTRSREDLLIGCVANLVRVKGHPVLLKAICGMPGAVLLFAGKSLEPGYGAALLGMARELGVAERVHFLGDVADIPAFLTEIDLFVLPTLTRGEGCPVALAEAMACGKACLATDVPGSRELIEHGRSGWLVPPDDVDGLIEGLKQLIDAPELCRALGDRARRRIVTHFGIEREVAAHEALYAEIL